RNEVLAEPAVQALLEQLWPLLSPQKLLEELYGDEDQLASAAPQLSALDREHLLRYGADWSPADVPLLDEAAGLLGDDGAGAWRAMARRCPLRSMTVVGDVAQTSSVGGGTSWASALGETFGDRWRLAELTLNYRTPAEVMDLANAVLREVDPSARAPQSIRST